MHFTSRTWWALGILAGVSAALTAVFFVGRHFSLIEAERGVQECMKEPWNLDYEFCNDVYMDAYAYWEQPMLYVLMAAVIGLALVVVGLLLRDLYREVLAGRS